MIVVVFIYIYICIEKKTSSLSFFRAMCIGLLLLAAVALCFLRQCWGIPFAYPHKGNCWVEEKPQGEAKTFWGPVMMRTHWKFVERAQCHASIQSRSPKSRRRNPEAGCLRVTCSLGRQQKRAEHLEILTRLLGLGARNTHSLQFSSFGLPRSPKPG